MEFQIQDVILVAFLVLSNGLEARKVKNAPEGIGVAIGCALMLGMLYWCGAFDAPCPCGGVQ